MKISRLRFLALSAMAALAATLGLNASDAVPEWVDKEELARAWLLENNFTIEPFMPLPASPFITEKARAQWNDAYGQGHSYYFANWESNGRYCHFVSFAVMDGEPHMAVMHALAEHGFKLGNGTVVFQRPWFV